MDGEENVNQSRSLVLPEGSNEVYQPSREATSFPMWVKLVFWHYGEFFCLNLDLLLVIALQENLQHGLNKNVHIVDKCKNLIA